MKIFAFLIPFLFHHFLSFSQTSNLDNLINQSVWNSLFPRRAGTFGTHPQGYNTDFFSYANFKQAVSELSDYLVQLKSKDGVSGQLITITRKSTSSTYIYNDVSPSWYSNPNPEIIVTVDFEDFVNTSSDANNKRELAAFLANISKETTGGWQLPVGGGSEGDYAVWGLYFVHELGYNSTNGAGAYSQASTEYPPNPAVGYYGRGPIQLSWNYNYGQFSKFLYNDKNVLLNSPDDVQNDGVLSFQSAIWFWMMPQCPKPSCHQVMHNLWIPDAGLYASNKMYKKGFAHTNNIINGGLECRSTTTAAFAQKVILRSDLYKYYLGVMGLSAAEIALEDVGDFTTLCYESASNTMENYLNCTVNNTVGITENQNSGFFVYPNPAGEMLNIRLKEPMTKIEIINVLGQVIKTSVCNSNQQILTLSDLPAGLFTLKVYSSSESYTCKFYHYE
jgi:hypothetical protein